MGIRNCVSPHAARVSSRRLSAFATREAKEEQRSTARNPCSYLFGTCDHVCPVLALWIVDRLTANRSASATGPSVDCLM